MGLDPVQLKLQRGTVTGISKGLAGTRSLFNSEADPRFHGVLPAHVTASHKSQISSTSARIFVSINRNAIYEVPRLHGVTAITWGPPIPELFPTAGKFEPRARSTASQKSRRGRFQCQLLTGSISTFVNRRVPFMGLF